MLLLLFLCSHSSDFILPYQHIFLLHMSELWSTCSMPKRVETTSYLKLFASQPKTHHLLFQLQLHLQTAICNPFSIQPFVCCRIMTYLHIILEARSAHSRSCRTVTFHPWFCDCVSGGNFAHSHKSHLREQHYPFTILFFLLLFLFCDLIISA